MMRRLALAACSLAVPLLLAAIGVRLLASGPFLRLVYGRPGFPAAEGFDAAERLALALPSTRFIVNDAPPAELAALRHAGAPLYSADEIAHLVDVRRVVRRLGQLASAFGLWLVLVGLAARRGGWLAAWARSLARGGWLTLTAVLLLVPALALSFDLAFTRFHQLLFEPGTWQFSDDSGLIRLFPERFWYDSGLAACATLVAGGLVVALVAGRMAAALERR
ncbi:MAG: DUF1461 domain-containing protein [Caldilineae bacterium]|nr:DUF1461 domain-containing protein [Chloroflexota bacterium]MCB9176012.1 DUF1461 domain-containing protein [Caldilineae bacterium]